MKKKQPGLILTLIGLVAIGLFILFDGFQPETKKLKIGVLNYAKVAEPSIQGFKSGLSELGFTEGQRIEYFYEGPIGDKAELAKVLEPLSLHRS